MTRGADEFIETKALSEGRKLYQDAIFSNRYTYKNVYFDSPAYKRSKLGNCFVSFFNEGRESYGQILYFVKFMGPPFFGKLLANVQKFATIKDVGRVKRTLIQVQPTEEENLVPIEDLTKICCIKLSEETSVTSSESFFFVRLLDVFEHS